MSERESMKDPFEDIIEHCSNLRRKKSQDYQNPNSTVRQADYYPNGVATIQDILHAKMLRARSLIESGSSANFESLADTYIDIINYSVFAIMYIRGQVDGQDPSRDHLNRPRIQDKVTEAGKDYDYPEPEGHFGSSPISTRNLTNLSAAQTHVANRLSPLVGAVESRTACPECGKVGCDPDGVGHYRG